MKRLICSVLLISCGGDDSGSGTVNLDDLGMDLAVVSCSKQFDCCTDAEITEQYDGIEYNGQPITTEEQCVEFGSAILTGFGVMQWKESLAMGRIEYDASAAAGCVSALEGLACDHYNGGQIDDLPSSCHPFIIPKVADGGGCTQDFECTSGNCVGATVQPDGPDTDGMCEVMPTAGQSCSDNCADGLYCGFDQTTGEEICQALKADGVECSLSRECTSESCDTTTHVCAAKPLVCDGR